MKQFRPGRIRLAIIALVIAPLLVSLAWREAVRPCDYIAHSGLLLLLLTLPFCTPLESGYGKQFAVFYVVGLTWGLWRGFSFDPITRNDFPGIGYLIVPLLMGGISALIFLIRAWLARRASGRA